MLYKRRHPLRSKELVTSLHATPSPKVREKAKGLVAKIQLFSKHRFDDYPLLVK